MKNSIYILEDELKYNDFFIEKKRDFTINKGGK